MVVNVDGSGEFNLIQGYLAGFPAWSPNGMTIAFAKGSGIAIIQRDGSGLTDLHTEREYPVWSPDGSQIAFMTTRDGNVEIYKMNNDGSAQTNLTKNPADDAFPAWSPDDTQIAFTSKRDAANYELYVINADGSQARWTARV
jgi:TolB protein